MSIKGMGQEWYVGKQKSTMFDFFYNRTDFNYHELNEISFKSPNGIIPGEVRFNKKDSAVMVFRFYEKSFDPVYRAMVLIKENNPWLQIDGDAEINIYKGGMGNMAMINCPECGKEVSDKATSCPNCGAPLSVHKQTKFCKHCGEEIDKDCVICPKCGKQVEEIGGSGNIPGGIIINNSNNASAAASAAASATVAAPVMQAKPKNKWVAFFLCLFFGWMGAHKFYEGKIIFGVVYIVTCGLFTVGWLIDTILILLKPNPYYI